MSDDDITILSVRPRPSEIVELAIPSDTLGAIRMVAAERDMQPEALLKLYIGNGLRADLARRAGASPLAPHLRND